MFINSAATLDVGSALNVGSGVPRAQQQQRELQFNTDDALRKRIKHLENMLSTYTTTAVCSDSLASPSWQNVRLCTATSDMSMAGICYTRQIQLD